MNVYETKTMAERLDGKPQLMGPLDSETQVEEQGTRIQD